MLLIWIGVLIIAIVRMKIFIIILMFFVIGALLIIFNNNLSLYREENMIKFKTLYFNWLDDFYGNIEFILKNIISMKWFPENKNI